jgi:tetratricopeptide (TPR) repeat protein
VPIPKKFARGLTAALLIAATSGCKGGIGIPIWNPFAKPATGLTQNGERSYTQPSAPQVSSSGSSWTAPFKKIGDAVTSPFNKSAQKTPPRTTSNDPIALASKNTPPNAALYVSLAKLQERSGNTETAVEEYNKALDAEPTNLAALLGLARLYDRLGRYEDALKLYDTAVQAHPENASVANDYGLCLARAGKLYESAQALRRAISLDSKKVLYRNNLATVLVEQQRPEEAFDVLVGAHGEAVAHYNVGYLLMQRERKSDAHRHFLAASRLDPNFKEARQWCELLQPSADPTTDKALLVASPMPTTSTPTTPMPTPTPTTTVTVSEPVAVPQTSTPAAVVPSQYSADGTLVVTMPTASTAALPKKQATVAPHQATTSPLAASKTIATPVSSRRAEPVIDPFQAPKVELPAVATPVTVPAAVPTTPAPAAAPQVEPAEVLDGPRLSSKSRPSASGATSQYDRYLDITAATPKAQPASPPAATAASQIAAAVGATSTKAVAEVPKAKPAAEPVKTAQDPRQPKFPASRY